MQELQIFRVFITIERDGSRMTAISDLVFLDAVTPVCVLEWTEGKSLFPAVSVPLNAAHLQKSSNPKYDYLYQFPVRDPRKSH